MLFLHYVVFFRRRTFQTGTSNLPEDFLLSAEFLDCLHTVIDNPYNNLFFDELLFTY